MSDMKCPFCGKRLDAVVKNQNDWIYSCGNPSCEFFDDCDNYEKKHYLATPEFWQELIRTRKTLETLQEFVTKLYLNGNITDEQLKRYKKMLITALEQKDVK